jgi:hypothetical protein
MFTECSDLPALTRLPGGFVQALFEAWQSVGMRRRLCINSGQHRHCSRTQW